MSDVQIEIMQALDKIDAKYNELEDKVSKKAEKEFCDKLGAQQHEMCRELAAIQQAQAKGAAEAAPAPSSVGGRFTAGNAYKNFAADVRNSRGARELVFTGGPTPPPPRCLRQSAATPLPLLTRFPALFPLLNCPCWWSPSFPMWP